jgi:hypothetical protein
MKIAVRILSIFVLGALTMFYVSCDGNEPAKKSETDQQIEKLNGTWKVTDATFENNPPTLDQTGMTITLSGAVGDKNMSYTVANRPTGPSAWPASGTLTFGTNPLQDLVREDGVNITYTVSGDVVTLDFNFDKTPYNARTSSVSGNWKYTLARQP